MSQTCRVTSFDSVIISPRCCMRSFARVTQIRITLGTVHNHRAAKRFERAKGPGQKKNSVGSTILARRLFNSHKEMWEFPELTQGRIRMMHYSLFCSVTFCSTAVSNATDEGSGKMRRPPGSNFILTTSPTFAPNGTFRVHCRLSVAPRDL